MLKQEQKENRNIYLCKLVLIQLGRNPTAFKVWVTNHYDQKCWCTRNTQGLFLVIMGQACCSARVKLKNIKYSFKLPFIRWYFGKGRTQWLWVQACIFSSTCSHRQIHIQENQREVASPFQTWENSVLPKMTWNVLIIGYSLWLVMQPTST